MKIVEYLFMPEEKQEAIVWQEQQAQKVIKENLAPISPKYIAGADVSYGKRGEKAFASVVVVDFQTNRVVEEATWIGEPEFSYRPGFFSLREVPCLLKVFVKLRTTPDVILIDGNGLIHQRQFGLACHMGICLDKPTIGCAKSLLIGKHNPVSKKKPEAKVLHNGQELGVAVRKNRETTYISIGHKVDIEYAKNLFLDLDSTSPIDHAHNLCSKLFSEDQKQQITEKDLVKTQIIQLAKELKQQGLNYSKVAQELNKYQDLRKSFGRKFTPRKIKNWLEEK